jgi:hypothetical protein
MLVAASVLPHPPLLVPEVAVATPDWLAELRAAVAASVEALLAAGPDLVVVVGSAPRAGEWDERSGGTMAPFGVDVRAGGADLTLPLSLAVGARVLDDAGWAGPRRYAALAADAVSHADHGARLAGQADRAAMLAMGDGSAKRSTEAPGYLDERATPFDQAIVAALTSGDAATVLETAPETAESLWAAGLPAWQALFGALGPNGTVDAKVRYDKAPRGVGYFVVDWAVAAPEG